MTNSQNNSQSGKQPTEAGPDNSHHADENMPVGNIETNILNDNTVVNDENMDNDILLKVETISDLREKEGSYENQEIILLGYYVSGDKNPLIYKFTTQNFSTLVDDGGAVIKTTLGSWIAQFVDTLSAEDYGAKGDGVADDSLYINKALENIQVKFLSFSKKTYLIGTSINLSDGKLLIGNLATLKTNSNINLILLEGNNRIDNLNLEGPGYINLNNLSVAISAIGTNSSNYISNITLNNVSIKSFAYYGILLEFCRNINIKDLYIEGVGYAGIMAFSVENVNIQKGYVKNITGMSTLGYGIAFTRRATDSSLIMFPRSKNCAVKDFLVENNPKWEGFDTHAGDNISFINCTTLNCKVGFAIVPSQYQNVDDHAPLSCKVTECRIEGIGTGAGIVISGAMGSNGNPPVEFATDCLITNNLIIGAGQAGNNIGGSIKLQATQSIIVESNNLSLSREIGINLYVYNSFLKISNNIILDTYSEMYSLAPCIAIRGSNNTGDITNNSTLRMNTTLGTYVSVQGIVLLSNITNSVNVGVGYNTCILASNEAVGINTKYVSLGGDRYLITNNATPEGAITAPRGSLCIVVNGTKGSILYLKETATGNTGWSNLTSVANATATVYGLVKQSIAIADVGSPNGVKATASTATDVAGVVTDLNDLISKFNTVVELVNETKSQLNASFAADRISGQQKDI